MIIPKCPKHNLEMVVKTAYRGKYAGQKFWGCPTWKQTKCNIIYPLTLEQENELKKKLNPYKGLNIFQRINLFFRNIKKWWNKSYYISGTSYNGAAQRFDWTKKTTNGQEFIVTIIILTVIISYIISTKVGNAVFAILICLPLLILIFEQVHKGIKKIFKR